MVPRRLPWWLTRFATALLVAGAAASACSTKTIDPLQLDGNRLIVNNRTADDWNRVEILVNHYYRGVVPSILAGQRLEAPLGQFVESYGRRFDFARQQITDVRLSATLPDGQPLHLTLDFQARGLAGLAGTGVFKKAKP